ncbi:hypothetical protein BGZ73_005291 [Actinomortierella ambigua]|nr:hypothetical protein BGZ73_005291 [Actinomortierella ambigua]
MIVHPVTPSAPNETRWTDLTKSLGAIAGICGAVIFSSSQKKAVACEEPKIKLHRTTTLPVKDDPPPSSQAQEDSTKDGKEQGKSKTGNGLGGAIPSIPLPKLPQISMDDLADKIQSWGDRITDEIKGRVPTLVDYFDMLDTMWKELNLAEGSIYQAIVANMQDPTKNPEIQLDATVRQGNDLCQQEKAFLLARKKKVRKAFAKFIGVKESEVHEEDIPVIALAGSGGGYRAMVSALGYMTAAKKSGLFDCAMYVAGVSGSCWMIAQYMTLGQRSFSKTKEHFKQSLGVHFVHYPSFIDTMLNNPGAAQLVLEGIVQKYSKNRVLTLVDAFGTLLAGRLLIHRERDGDNEEWVDPLDFKMSQQSRWTNYGDQPMPIYTAVSHVLPAPPKPVQGGPELVVDDEVTKEEDDPHYYQWFEVTPYEFGSEETSAWIPTWSFGRRFVEGKSIENIPETNLAILLGTFGSAFTATLADYYNEVRPLVNKAISDVLDSYVQEYLDNMSMIHPLSPSCFPNPVYKLKGVEPEMEEFTQHKNLYLNDAGMDNNLPLYPLLRPGRNVDVILAFDSSADIESVPWFEKADEYAQRRGIERWPPISKHRAKQLEKEGANHKMKPVEIFHGIVADDRDVDHVADHEKQNETVPKASDAKYPVPHPITMIYFPLIPNESFGEFDPATDPFCSTWNFEIKDDQVETLGSLAESNFAKGIEDVRHILHETWQRKKKERIEAERRSKKDKKHQPHRSA